MLETPRLTLIPLTLEQLHLYVADTEQLEENLGLQTGHRVLAEPVLSIVIYFTIPRVQDPALNPLFHTLWMAIDYRKQQFVAEAKFKGEPDETGTVEIGYGTYPTVQRQGYMTEMVAGLLQWAARQPGVWRVVADTEKRDTGSSKVLKNNGFRQFDELEEMLWWEYEIVKEETHYKEI